MKRAIQNLIVTFAAVGLFAIFNPTVSAQGYVPDIVELDGTRTLEFPAHESLDLSGGATIEFWVQPDWKQAPDFDPVVLSYAGKEGASYLVALLRDRDGIGLMSGDKFEVAPFDFTDGQVHHVALIDYGDETEVLIDNDLVAVLPITLKSLPADGLFIGSTDGANDPFLGAIGAVRLWGVPLEQNTVLRYAAIDIVRNPDVDHPDLPFLVAHSAFETDDFLLAEAAPLVPEGGN